MAKPIKEYRSVVASIKCAVWQKESGYISFSIGRSKKDDDGKWQNETFYLTGAEIVALRSMFDRALKDAETNYETAKSQPKQSAEVPPAIKGAFPGSVAEEVGQEDIPF